MNILILKIVLRTVSILMALLLVAIGIVYYLLNSQGGANFLATYATDYLQENFQTELQYDSLRGSLLTGLEFENLQVNNPQLTLQASNLSSQWSLWPLLSQRIDISQLEISDLDLRLSPGEGEATASVPLDEQILQVFSLPFSIEMENILLINPRIQSGEQILTVQSLGLDILLNQRLLRLDEITFTGYGATLNGAFALQAEDLLLDGNLDWTLDRNLLPDQDAVTAGSVFFSGDINSLDLSHSLIQPLSIESEGSLATGLLDQTGINFNLEHQLEDLLPLLPQQNFLSGFSGTLLTHGSPELVFLDGSFALVPELNNALDPSQQLLPLTLTLAGEYEEQGLSFETLRIESDEISLEAVSEISLQPFGLDMDWGLNRLEINDYLSAITLDAVQAGGSLSLDENNNTRFRLSFLQAQLNGYPLEAEGELQLEDNRFTDVSLDFSTGRNQLSLQGQMQDNLDINWLLSAPDLSVWLPALSGRILGEGLISGNIDNPDIQGTLEADNLRFEEAGRVIELASIDSSIQSSRGNYQFQFNLGEVNAAIENRSFIVSETQIEFTGEPQNHEASLNLRSPELDIDLAVQGSYASEQWQGSILSSSLDGVYGNWILQEPVAAGFSSQRSSMSRHCWQHLDTAICLQASQADSDFSLDIALQDFPLAYLNTDNMIASLDDADLNQVYSGKPPAIGRLQQEVGLYLPQNTFVEGLLNMDIQVQGDTEDVQSADFSLGVEPGSVFLNLFRPVTDDRQSVAPEIQTFELQHNNLQVNRTEGVLNGQTRLNILHRDSGGLDFQGDISAALTLYPDDSMEGGAELDFSSLNWVETLFPDMRNTRGEISGNLDISGSLDDPMLLANLNLQNASFELPEYGISPEQINLTFSSDEDENIFISASAVSGEGNLTFSGNANTLFDPQRSFTLVLQGENFRLINDQSTSMTVSPVLEVNFQNNALDLQGSVLVPELLMDIRENATILLNNGIDVTRDAVIVNAPPEQAYLMQSRQQQSIREIPVSADLELLLGDNVRFQGFGLDMMLDGNLRLQQDVNRPLLAYGDISIREGVYEIYGQSLNVTDGKLIFFGNPSNPSLDIRAYRETETVQAGVLINGTIRNMQSQLFSTPSLPESEILSILITGKSFSDTNNQDQSNLLGAAASLGINRSGLTGLLSSGLGVDTLDFNSESNLEQSSLGLGKYLTPDLFMHYEIGLFEKESVLSLDYILNERLRLEVESGISQSIDMTYRIEK